MTRAAAKVGPRRRVFLNVPFDSAYEDKFLALIAACVAVGRRPCCVVEVPSKGEDRLERIFSQLETCRASIHDLSRVADPPRFNMPFELGFAYGLRRASRDKHDILLLDEKPYQAWKHLSDIGGHETHAHGNDPRRVLRIVVSELGQDSALARLADVEQIWTALAAVAKGLKAKHGATDLYTRLMFRQLVFSAAASAASLHLISPGLHPKLVG